MDCRSRVRRGCRWKRPLTTPGREDSPPRTTIDRRSRLEGQRARPGKRRDRQKLSLAQQLRHASEQTLRDGIEGLPAEYREVLVLREMEGLSYKQLAKVTGAPIGTVMSRLARARKRLHDALVETARKEPT